MLKQRNIVVIWLAFCTLILIGKAQEQCPTGWELRNGMCYFFSPSSAAFTFTEAESWCLQNNGHLVSFLDVDEREWVVNRHFQLTGASRWWIGLTDHQQEGVFRWVDGNSLDDEVANWRIGEPNNAYLENCAEVWIEPNVLSPYNQKWNDNSCEGQKPYACKRPIGTVSQCPDGWTLQNSRCYQVRNTATEWFDANEDCRFRGGEVVSISTSSEQQTIQALLGSYGSSFWIGLSDTASPGTFAWSDKSTTYSYNNWSKDQPPNPLDYLGSTCAEISPAVGFKWLTGKCSNERPYVCERGLKAQCPQGWLYSGEKCYEFVVNENRVATWTEANKNCQAIGAGLLKIENNEQQTFVSTALQGYQFANQREIWMGASDIGHDDQLLWWDKSVIQQTFWDYNMPKLYTDRDDCTNLYTGKAAYNWEVTACFYQLGYICEVAEGKSLATLPAVTVEGRCESGWRHYNKKCYFFSGEELSQNNANSYCRGQNAELASVLDEDELSFFMGHLQQKSWIGLMIQGASESWTDGEQVAIQNWMTGEPDGDGNCVTVDQVGFWEDQSCSTMFTYICKKDEIPTETYTPTPPPYVPDQEKCGGNGWISDPQSEKCYKINLQLRLWYDARYDCQMAGGDLVSINTPNEQLFLENFVKGVVSEIRLWTGGNDMHGYTLVDQGWNWADGSPFNYLHWASGEPNNENNEDCMQMYLDDGYWNDVPCTIYLGSICEKLGNTDNVVGTDVSDGFCRSNEACCFKHIGAEYRGWIPDSAFSASTEKDMWFNATRGRLNTPADVIIFDLQNQIYIGTGHGAWEPQGGDPGPYLQVDLPFHFDIKGIITQGRNGLLQHEEMQWTKTYKVRYSQDVSASSNWEWVSDIDGNAIIFDGNNDQNTMVTNIFPRPIIARHLRCYTLEYRDQAALRLEYIGCKASCLHKLGMNSGFITDDKITASSEKTSYEAKQARAPVDTSQCLSSSSDRGTDYRGWIAKTVSGLNCQLWSSQSPHSHLETPQNYPNAGLVGDYCRNPNGRAEGPWCYTMDINKEWEPCAIPVCPNYVPNGWRPTYTTTNEFVQVQFMEYFKVGAITLYKDSSGGYVTEYRVLFSNDGSNFKAYENADGSEKRFTGLDEFASEYMDILREPASTMYIRIQPLSWKNMIVLNFEINGCYGDLRLSCSDLGTTFLDKDTFTVDCPGGCLEDSIVDPVIGTDIYTSNSAICPSAIHAGKSTDFIGGAVTVTMREGQTSYASSYRNGITSDAYGAYPSSFTFTGNTLRCDDGWRPWNGNCYYFSPKGVLKTWQEARSACLGMASDLVTILSQGENDFVESMLVQMNRGVDAWLGMSDLDTTNYFIWADGSPVLYTKWFYGEPNNQNNRGEHCVQMYIADGYWNDIACDKLDEYICKRPKQFLPPMTTIYPPTDSGCDSGWTGYGPSCYRVSNDEYIQMYANIHCQEFGANLVTIHDEYEQAFVHALVTNALPDYTPTTAWIGLTAHTDPVGGQYYKWGDSGEPVTYTHWDLGEPEALLECTFPFVYQGVTYYECTTTENPIALLNQPWCSVDAEWRGRLIYCGNDNPQACTNLDDQTGFWQSGLCVYIRYYVCEKDRLGYTQPLLTTPSTSGSCPFGWFGNEMTTSCYQINDKIDRAERLNWMDALDNCRAQGADLVSIHSSTEETQIFSFVASNNVYSYTSFWLGLNGIDPDAGYQWTDSTPVIYTNWGVGEPNDHNNAENCVESQLMTSATWNDLNCDALRNWVCKIKKGVTPHPPPTLPPPMGTVSTECGTDVTWIRYQTKYGADKCYLFESTKIHAWPTAEKTCVEYGGHLTSLHDADEKTFLLSRMSKTTADMFWIGLRDVSEREFMWSDGTLLDFVSWEPGEPNDYLESEGCTEMSAGNGNWNDDNCGLQQPFVCAKYMGAQSVSVPPTQQPTGYCPAGFTPYGNKCWMVGGVSSSERLSWYDALERCQNNSASLAVIQNDYEQAFISSLLYNIGRNTWIGLRSLGYAPFLWADESELYYTNWGAGEPNLYYDACVKMQYSSGSVGKWNDDSCTGANAFICYTPISQSNPVPEVTQPSSNCPSGYKLYGDSCFKLVDTPSKWSDARTACQNEGDGIDLASISQVYENNLIKSWFWREVTTGTTLWNGLTYITTTTTPPPGTTSSPLTETIFSWSDNWPVSYTNWGTGEPNTDASTSGCGFVNSDGTWAVVSQTGAGSSGKSCDTLMPFVCKKNLLPIPTTPDPGNGICDPGFEGYGQYCYYIEVGIYTDLTRSWWEAEHECESRGATLASFHNEGECLAVVDMIDGGSHNLWIGLSHDGFSGWTWSDGSAVEFFNWGPGEPNGVNSGEVCVEMYPWNSQWNDVDCLQGRGYVCKVHKSYSYCGAVPVPLRQDCGYTGIEESMCLRRGCCWDLTVITANFSGCFYPQNFEFPSQEPVPVDSALSGGAIAGIVIGVLLLVAIAAAAYWFSRDGKKFDFSVPSPPSFMRFGSSKESQAGFDNPVVMTKEEKGSDDDNIASIA